MSMTRQSFVGWAFWLTRFSRILGMDRKKKSWHFPDLLWNEKWNARAHSVREHLQHFQSPQSYHAHALSSVMKSSLTQRDMTLPVQECMNLWPAHTLYTTCVITFLLCAAEWLPYRPPCCSRHGGSSVSGKVPETKTPEQAQELRSESHV